MPSEPPPRTSLVVEVHPGPEAAMYMDGAPGQIPVLALTAPGAEVLVSPDGSTVTDADVAAGEALAQAAADYAVRLRELRQSQT